jgi:hypothetical protein
MIRKGIYIQVVRLCFAAVLLLTGITSPAQQPQGHKQALQQHIAQIKESIAKNQAALRQYTWIETTEISLKGEVKKTTQKECRYGADGKVVKTPIQGEQPQQEGGKKPRGLRGKIVEKKVAELKDYGERFGNLIGHYVPPDPDRMKASFQAGNASLEGGGGAAALGFKNYYKEGDKVTLTFDTAAKQIRGYDVASFLDGPKDVATLSAKFANLDGGANYLSETVLNSQEKQLQIRITNSGYRKTGSK